MIVSKLNLQKYARLEQPVETVTKVRYKHDGTPATIRQTAGDQIDVRFHEGVSAIAPGQAAVFYEGDDVIGGGWIMKSFRQSDAHQNADYADASRQGKTPSVAVSTVG